jgi:hypothetical protein
MKNAPTRLGPRRATMTSDQSSIEDSRILSEVSPRAQPSPSPSQLLAVFRERCGAQALMVAEGMLALQDAVDTLQQAAKSWSTTSGRTKFSDTWPTPLRREVGDGFLDCQQQQQRPVA